MKETPEEFRKLTLDINERHKVAIALLEWAETTHGNEFGHDHHCVLTSFPKKGPWVEAPDEPPQDPTHCTCGWAAFRVAYDKMQERLIREAEDARSTGSAEEPLSVPPVPPRDAGSGDPDGA